MNQFAVTTNPTFLPVDNVSVTLRNVAGQTITYADTPTGAGSSLASGSSITLSEGKWLRTSSGDAAAFVEAATAEPRGELAYAELTTNTGALANTTFADIPNISLISFEVANRPVALELFIPVLQLSSATAICGIRLVDYTAAVVHASTDVFFGIAFAEMPVTIRRRFVTPGTYTAKVQSKVTNGNHSVNAGTYLTPLFVTAVEV